MSLALAHFAVGAAGMTLLVGVFAPRSRFKGTAIMLSGIWAMIPDAYHVAPGIAGWTERIHDTAFVNVFWFHRLMDVYDPTDSTKTVAIVVAGWLLVTLLVEFGSAIWTVLRAQRSSPTHG